MTLRVQSGRFRGRRLASPPGRETRPASGRMRQAVMNILGPDLLSGASVLDIFAGTGAVGIEALSRGARRVLFVESARPALAALRRNLADLDLGPGEAAVLPGDAVAVLSSHAPLDGAPFDLLFCDPPYSLYDEPAREGALRDALGAFVTRGGLSPGGRVIVEHPAGRGPVGEPRGLVGIDGRAYSAAGVTFFAREAPPGPPDPPQEPVM